MNIKDYKDYPVTGTGAIAKVFRVVFIELFPQLSKKSFEYHLYNYIDECIKEDQKVTIFEELERFRSYLLVKYQKEEQ